jgi:hypothetical protein
VDRPIPHFKAHISVTFEEPPIGRTRIFGFDDNGHRRVPMQMDGVEGLNTVGLWTNRAAEFSVGDEFDADCVVLSPERFKEAIQVGKRFKLWHGGFFANGVVTERIEEGWKL